jgi:molybdate transport system substrate-binding protein
MVVVRRALLGAVALSVVLAGAFFTLRGAGHNILPVGARDQSGNEPSLLLYAGAGIQQATTEIVEAYEVKTGARVQTTYGSCGQLLVSINANRRGDLYMPGSLLYVEEAIEKGLAIAETKRDVAEYIPVIFVQKGNPKGIETLWDLTKPGLRVGLGDERACVIGKWTRIILEKNDIPYEELAPNVVYQAATSPPLGFAIQAGAVDAVITWYTNARRFGNYGDIIEIPPSKNMASTVPILMLTSSRHPQEAQQFIKFVASEEGREILQERGFLVGHAPSAE